MRQKANGDYQLLGRSESVFGAQRRLGTGAIPQA